MVSGAAMTLDVRGGVKNSKPSANPYVVIEELVSNSIDAFLIRTNSDSSIANLIVTLEVSFLPVDLIDDQDTISISCTDNGCGLGDPQLKAFLTMDTSYKDDLHILGIGKCKGAGRIQYFHQFATMSIGSTYRDAEGRVLRRHMDYSGSKKQIEAEDFITAPGKPDDIGTKITLEQLREPARALLSRPAPLNITFSAAALRKQILVAFLQRLVSLDDRLGDFEFHIITHRHDEDDQHETLKRADLPKVTLVRQVNVQERDPSTGVPLDTHQTFELSHYRLDADLFDLPRNAIALCAKSSPAKDITQHYLRTKTEQNNPVGGFHHIVLIESDYLDERVNEQRDGFENIPEQIVTGDLFNAERLSYEAIFEAIDPVVHEMVVPADWKRDDVLKEVTSHFGVSEGMLADTSTRILYGDEPRTVAERVLKKYQELVIEETAEIVNLKDEIINAEPDSEEFRSKINELAWKYTASLENFDKANLSQLVVRRTAIVEILALACKRALAIQTAVPDGKRRRDERIIHSIFFPMRRDSTQVSDHDVWLLNEEYQYYDYIASDVPLSSITWDDGKKLFDADIDDEFRKLLEKRADDNGGKRPDIAIFSKEGSAIIVEFKAPGVPMDEHVGDLSEYSYLLAAKSAGKLNRFYGYLIGDTVNALRLNGWTAFPIGNGLFNIRPVGRPPHQTGAGRNILRNSPLWRCHRTGQEADRRIPEETEPHVQIAPLFNLRRFWRATFPA